MGTHPPILVHNTQATPARTNPNYYFYCLGRQRLKNGCTFRATQVHHLERLVEDHWSTVTLKDEHVETIRAQVWQHIDDLLPKQGDAASEAKRRLLDVTRKSQILLEARYAGAIDNDHLRIEQQRLASERADAERILGQQTATASHLQRRVTYCCDLLRRAQDHYLESSPRERRDLNQAVLTKLWIHDDEVVGCDLTPPLQRLLDPDLENILRTERNATQSCDVELRTSTPLSPDPPTAAGGVSVA